MSLLLLYAGRCEERLDNDAKGEHLNQDSGFTSLAPDSDLVEFDIPTLDAISMPIAGYGGNIQHSITRIA